MVADTSTVLNFIKEHQIEFVDLRFTDTRGKEHHVSVLAETVDQDFLLDGKMFDGSSIAGWKGIERSDMILKPELDPLIIDPFFERPTLILRCDVLDPSTMINYERDPRSLAKRAEEYLKSTGIATECFVGPEPEFFIFDDVRYRSTMNEAFYHIDSIEAAWNSGSAFEAGNRGHRPSVKGGYFPVPPVDSAQDIRSEICIVSKKMGLKPEVHHHEVGTGGQNEIAIKFNTPVKKGDEIQLLKYGIHNVAHQYGKTATFMPKPLVGDNGSGMHCHMSLSRNGENLFFGDKYAGLSDMALYFIGGILKHARALNAFTNPTTNSYKRLVPGYEAPVLLAYSACNRSAAIRIPHANSPKGKRIEVRFPDPSANPYLAFAAMLMAGLDGIKNKLHPGDPMDKDLYNLPPEELSDIPTSCDSLEGALQSLNEDRNFLLEGGVFTNDLIDAYIELRMGEVTRLKTATHPLEFELYYSV